MKTSKRHDFKDTQVYDWEVEPKDERPSEFAPSTTGYTLHSGFYVAPVVTARRSRRGGGLTVWLLTGSVLGAALIGLFGLVRVLKGA